MLNLTTRMFIVMSYQSSHQINFDLFALLKCIHTQDAQCHVQGEASQQPNQCAIKTEYAVK